MSHGGGGPSGNRADGDNNSVPGNYPEHPSYPDIEQPEMEEATRHQSAYRRSQIRNLHRTAAEAPPATSAFGDTPARSRANTAIRAGSDSGSDSIILRGSDGNDYKLGNNKTSVRYLHRQISAQEARTDALVDRMTATVVEAMDKSFRAFEGKFEKRLQRLENGPQQRDAAPRGEQSGFAIPPEGVRLGAHDNLDQPSPPENFYRQMASGSRPPMPAATPSRSAPQEPYRHRDRHPGGPPPDREHLRGAREGTCDSILSQPSRNPDKIKREEIGIFNPDYPDPDDLGIVQDGKNLIFTDVYSFVDRIATFTESLGEEASRQILGHFQAILGGSAILWWTNELMAARRIELRSAGLLAILDELIVRFGPDAANATKSFYDCKLYLRDVAADEQALQQFVQKKLRWARSIRMLGPDHSNWSSAMMMIWSHMEFEIQQCLPRPDEFASLSDYMKKIEKSRIIVNSAALKYYPHLVKKSSNKTSLKSLDKVEDRPRSSRSSDRREQSRSSRREERYRDDEYRPRDRYRDNRRRDRDGNRDQRKDYDRRDKERDDRGKRDEKDRKHRDDRYRKDDRDRDRKRDHDRVHFAEIDDDSGSDADHSDASSSVSYPSDSEVDIACLVFDANRTCRKCHKEFDDKTELRHHVKTCEVKGPLRSQRNCQANLQNPARRTCGHCGELAGSRNALFKHLKHCQGAKSGTFDRPADPGIDEAGAARIAREPAPDDTSEAPEDLGEINFVKEAPTLGDDKPLEGPLGNFTYLRVNARTSPKKGDVEVCFDPGAGRSIVGRNFLRNLDYTIEKREGKVSGIGGGILKLKEWATFSLYLPGVENGKKTLFKFTRGAWVIDKLLPNLLLGNDFMDPYRANIDYDTKIVHLRAIDFAVPFSIRVHSVPCVRRVKTTRAITLLPDQEAMIPVNYKPLPKGRSFLFNAEHDAAFHAVITAKTPKVVAVKNTSRGTITIPKRYPVGKIDENHDSGFLACSWNTAFKTMAVGATLMSMAKPTTISDIEPANFALQNTNSLPVSAEFDFDKRTAAVAEHDLGLRAPDAPTVENYNGTSSTPVSDYVYQLTRDVTVDLPINDQTSEQPDLPVVPEKQSTLGIRMVDNLPEIVTKEGVHIFAENSQLAARFAELVRRLPRLWEDTGLIKLPPEQLMRVPLVEGWQNQRVSSCSYPLSRRDRQLLDEIFDGLHKQGKMIWATRATPFAHPVFVVWRTVKGVTKGRVVIDLRGLNRVSVPDNYPLPLQAEIIGSLRGKRYITAIDATAFFYQFGLHPPHRDRFTLISPRGLEQPTVCLMGYRNSPAHVQRIMDQLLKPHAEYARAFIDDIVIFSNDAEDHLKHLERIFRLFHDKNVAIAPTKSFIGYPSVELLGFRVDSLGLTTTAQRVEAFRNLAFPKTLKALEQWIGATGFLRHLIPYYAQLLEPLQKRKTALLAQGRENGQLVSGNQGKRANYCAKTTFEPSEAERLSFDSIQKVICAENPSILYHFDPDKPLFLQVDGCLERGCGVMVFHVQDGYEWKPGSVIPSKQVQPVMFLSRCLTKAELRYGPSEQEVACLVWAVKKLRTMIHSSRHPVNVLTDHSSTRGIVEQTRLDTSSTDRSNRRLITASVYLSEYDLKVFHLPGRLNFVPDALSRLTAVQDKPEREEGEVILDNVMFAWAEAQMDDSLKNEFIAAYHEDSKYSAIIKDLISGEPAEGSGEFFRPGLPFVLTGGLLYNIRPDGLRSICIPHKMVKTVLSMVHDQKHHFGIDRMLYDLRGVSMVNKTRQVRKFAQHCPQCNVVSTDRQPPIGTLQPIRPADTLPMRVIGIDFIVGLPTVPSEGSPWQLKGKVSFDSLLTVSCKSSKRTLLIPGHTTYTAQQWGQVLMRQLFLSDWGVPSAIISDRDRKFTSEFWQGMWESLGTKLLMTAAYHPQSDGLAERKNQTVEIAMRFFVFERPEANWTDLITPLQWNLNSSYSAPIQSSPHEQLFGFKLPGPFEALAIPPSVESDIPSMRESLREDARLAMDFAAARAKRRYDANRRDIEFREGDKVYLRLHKGYHLPGNPPRKLSQQRTGPFEVVRRVGRLAYELKFPENMGIHPVISIAHLSPTPPGNDPFDRHPVPPGPVEDSQASTDSAPGEDYEVEVILRHRVTRRKYEYLIKWKGWGHEHNVWKTEYELRHTPRLLKEYWQRQGGQPALPGDDATEPRRKRGRPRKNVAPAEEAPAANREPEVPPKDGRRRSRRLVPTGTMPTPASEEATPASTTAAPQ